MQIFLTISAFILYLLAINAQAASDCDPSDEDCVLVGDWQFSVGIGAGVRTNPLADADDIPLVLIPQVSYQGEHVFIENLDIGVILSENQHQQINLLMTPSYDQVFFHRWSPSNFFIDGPGVGTAGNGGDIIGGGDDEDIPVIDQDVTGGGKGSVGDGKRLQDLHDRHMAGLAGIEYNLTWDSLELQFHYLHDITRVHEGEEARVVIAKPWVSNRHRLLASVGFNWQSQEVLEYYYGAPKEEVGFRHRYTATDGVSQIIRVDWNYQLTDSWDLRVLASVRHLPDAISASPLVNDNHVITAFVGGVYHF